MSASAQRTGVGALAFAVSITLAFAASPVLADDEESISPFLPNLNLVTLDDAALLDRALQRSRLGSLEVTSGSIVAADPLVQPDRPAFSRMIEPGAYPVFLYRLAGVDPRVALAEVRLSDEKPVRWEWALIPGQSVSTLEEGFVFGYPVDAGTGSFYDADAWKAMQVRTRNEASASGVSVSSFDYYHEILEPMMWTDEGLPIDIMHVPLEENRANMAIFSSGWGDGFYSTFWGIGASGDAVALVTDFAVATKGDAREPGEQFSARMRDEMSVEEQAASAQAFIALVREDADMLRAMLEAGEITPMTWLFDTTEHVQDYALQSDLVPIMQLLVEYGADGTPSPFETEYFNSTSLLATAEKLNTYGFREPLSKEMMALVRGLPVTTKQ
ncbi:MAG: DUF4241 domain-containing protein [Pseudomonadota bacterium]